MNNKFYHNYYLEKKKFFLEYPEEILLKLNQSVNNLKLNNQIIKNKINLSFNNKIKNVIFSTKSFINDLNDFNLNYIIHKINKDDIFGYYSTQKINFLKSFFNSFRPNLNNIKEITGKSDLFIKQYNYDYYINRIENNYSNFSSNLNIEIDKNFSTYNCSEHIDNEYISESDMMLNDNDILKDCQKKKYSSELNYSKYNFNIVKLRAEISNSMKFPEMIEQWFKDLKSSIIIDSNELIEIDNLINFKNIINISNETNFKLKEIENNFLLSIEESFIQFCNESLKKIINLTDNYWHAFNYYKDIINFKNILYKDNISNTYNYISGNIEQLLNHFNSTLYNAIDNIIKDIDYFSIDFTTLEELNNHYLSIIESSFNYYKIKIMNLK